MPFPTIPAREPADLWVHRTVPPVTAVDRAFLYGTVLTGAVSLLVLADWWFRPAHVASPALFFALSLAFWYGMGRIAVGWVSYVGLRRPEHRPAPPGLRVAIFTTSSPGEPLAMFEKTLEACARVRYPHTTYLLDDTQDPRFREVAERHGAVWLELVGLPGAKAGKINAALERTDEEFVLVLDPDHIPFPNFLDRVLGQFEDAGVGFVQVCQAYYNQARSFVARGAAEQTYAFYGPLMMGMFGHGTSVAIGANCTFRREALQSIGGHGIGLAEDLVTSVRLHAAGWRSVYVPEVVSRGLVPEDLGSFYKQQLKWARGVYEVLFSEVPRLFRTLTWRQRLSYTTIGTYYLFGATTLLYLAFPYLYLWAGVQPASMRFVEFLAYVGPVATCGVGAYLFVQRWLCHPAVERGLHWRGLVLKVACWPVFLVGTVLAVLRRHIPYIPTAKEAAKGHVLRLAWPHLLLIGLFVVTVAKVALSRLYVTHEGALVLTSEAVWGMAAFASLAVAFATGAVYAAWTSRTVPEGQPWEGVDLDLIDAGPDLRGADHALKETDLCLPSSA